MVTLTLSRMERLALSGIEWRYRREAQDAMNRRNRDMLAVLEEHGYHDIPDTYLLRFDRDGYVCAVQWDNEAQGDPEEEQS